MARFVELTCAHCGHQQMHVVDAEKNGSNAQAVIEADEPPTAEASRLQRLKSLPTSMPVGGIITPV